MVAWFVIAIGTIALFAYIAVAGIGTVDAAGTAVSRAETIRRLDAVVATLSKRATAPTGSGVVMLPAGVPTANGYLLPADLQQVGRTTTGAQFQYCPMGVDLANQNGTVDSTAGGSYGIQTVDLNGSSYVASGRASTGVAADRNISGFVIAPVGAGVVPAGCNQVQASGDGYIAPNSLVRVIRLSTTTNEDLNRDADAGTWYVSPTGAGSGSSPSDPASLASALDSYRTSNAGRYIVRLSAGTYSLAGSPLDQSVVAITPKRTGSSLSLVGTGGVSLSLGRVYVPGDFEIRGIDARNTQIVADGGRFVGVRSASVGPVILLGGSRLNVADTSAIFSSDSTPASLQVQGGSTAQAVGNVDIYYSSGKALATVDGSSSLTFSDAYVNGRPISTAAAGVKSDSAIIVKPGGKLTVKNTVIDFNMSNEWAIAMGGSMMSVSSTYNFNAYTWVGLQTLPGATVNMAGVTWRGSQPPRYTFATQSSSMFSGNGNIYSTGRCWYRGDGSLHRLSPTGVQGDTSMVTPDENRPMAAQPTAQQAADYQAAQARNADRANLRSRMTVGEAFTCQQSTPVTWSNCANNPGGAMNENGYCTLPPAVGNVLVRYGANGSYAYQWASNGIACDNATFTDPLVGTLKGCTYAQ